MTRFLLTLTVLVLSAAFATAALLPRASGNPACFACPPQDQLGFALGDHSDTAGTLFCSYPAVEGEDPNDFFCTYSDTTGALIQDNDAGLCEPTAVPTCDSVRRDDNFKAMKRRRAALPQSSGQQARSIVRKKRAN